VCSKPVGIDPFRLGRLINRAKVTASVPRQARKTGIIAAA